MPNGAMRMGKMLLVAALICAPLAAGSAQATTVYSTLAPAAGPVAGGGGVFSIYDYEYPSLKKITMVHFWDATSFWYTGPDARLSDLVMSVAHIDGGQFYFDILVGESRASATLLESIGRVCACGSGALGAYTNITMQSSTMPLLTGGNRYWISPRSLTIDVDPTNYGSQMFLRGGEPGSPTINARTTDFGQTWTEFAGNAWGFSIVAVVVPEPSTYALMAAGLIGLGVIARRRRSMQPLA